MLAYLIRRIFQGFIVLVLVILFTFILEHMVPGGPAVVALGHRATKVTIAQFNKENGLDRPIIIQFWSYLTQVLRLNLGYSLEKSAAVWFLIKSALAHTSMLVAVSIVFQFIVAIPLGAMQARRRNTQFDYFATGITFVLYAIPVFLIGEFLISLFTIKLNLLPGHVSSTDGAFSIFTNPVEYILPILTLSLVGIGGLSRFQRSSVVDTYAQDYIRTARAKGLSEKLVLRRHALRNSILPIITIIGLSLPALVGGALITESLFGIPGMGELTLTAANSQDMPLVVGTTIVATIMTIVGSLVADLLYAVADPRIRIESR